MATRLSRSWRLSSRLRANYAFALDLLQEYRQTGGAWTRPGGSTSTRRSDGRRGRAGAGRGDRERSAQGRPKSRAPVRPRRPVGPADARAAGRAGNRGRWDVEGVARVSILPGDVLEPIRGGAVRIVENMEASLQIPTATSVRTLPVRTLEENRRVLNRLREAAGLGKVSFTHLVAWAILRALDTFPRMNDAYAEVEGQPHRIQRDQVPLGIASTSRRRTAAHAPRAEHPRRAEAELRRVPDGLHDLVARSRKGHDSPTTSWAPPSRSPTRERGHDLVGAAAHAGQGSYRTGCPRNYPPSTSRWPRARWGSSGSAR